ncbi:Protein AIM2-like protein 7 [Colletotrichum chlorophyti]|uniref:Protein AIM2-like protein 7 n=1 Tax=Colletotrichum chlorophyti TaxID=708187 RepID=A0A1Q8S5Q3_9PEZI|nr:Protein AIM2-like protein 7 [Colletotrichum chlorophyti]
MTILMGVAATALNRVVAERTPSLHSGNPAGIEITYKEVKFYVSKPNVKPLGKKGAIPGVLFLSDITGIQPKENKLLVDGFAREGFVTVAPDLFNGSPAQLDPNLNVTEFLNKHPPEVTDSIVKTAVAYLRDVLGIKKIAASGYCFGGRYAVRVLSGEDAVDVAFTAHPSLLTTEEVKAVQRPLGLANAENDPAFPLQQQTETNNILGQLGHGFAASLYSGVEHGFAVRANLSDPEQKFAKEEAFSQAARFFKLWAQ